MKVKSIIKKLVEKTPYPVGRFFAKVPFKYRLGKEYTLFQKTIKKFNLSTEEEQYRYILMKLNNIVTFAYKNIPFYTNLYNEHGIKEIAIRSIDDFNKLPIITKDMIRANKDTFSGAMQINTGGTSGEPLKIYLDKNAFAREWAHMHFIWSLKGYRYTDLKFTLRGKNLGKKNIIYNPVHNEFIINSYKHAKELKSSFLKIIMKQKNSVFIHGYPSTVYQFFNELDNELTSEEKTMVMSKIKTCLLGSEFPLEYITKYLEEVWKLDYISWYGHSEMAILAFDLDKNNHYKPMMTYGFAEVHGDRLLGTSFNNFDMPLIRYDTGDRVSGINNQYGILQYFSVTEGREGDFIIDKNGKKISLTALIFGRHHDIFNFADFVQIKDEGNGKATLLITLKKNNKLDSDSAKNFFDLKNIDIDFSYKILQQPVRSKIGKLKLKI